MNLLGSFQWLTILSKVTERLAAPFAGLERKSKTMMVIEREGLHVGVDVNVHCQFAGRVSCSQAKRCILENFSAHCMLPL